MRGTVLDVEDRDGSNIVVLRASVGVVRGVWTHQSQRPLVGVEYSIEVDVDGVLTDFMASASDGEACRVSPDGSLVMLTGVVDGTDIDGMVYLRLSQDCLIMVEAEPGAVSRRDRLCLAVPVPRLTLSPL